MSAKSFITPPSGTKEIPPRTGTAFKLVKGQTLTVIDPRGVQVSDLLAYNADDVREVISNGRTLEYVLTAATIGTNFLPNIY